jgi:hypothetical protein
VLVVGTAGVGLFVDGGTTDLLVVADDGFVGVGVGLAGVALVVASVVVLLVADVGVVFTGAIVFLVTRLDVLTLTTLVTTLLASLVTLFAPMALVDFVTATGFLSRVGSLVGRWTGRSRGLGLALALLLLGRGRVVDVVVGDGAGVHGCDRGGRPGGGFAVLFDIAILGVAILLDIAICGV